MALREFGIPGKKPSVSRASIQSGLTRKEVQRLLTEADAASRETRTVEKDNRAVRVLSAWTRDRELLGTDGQPLTLPLQGGSASLATLVRRYSGDMPVRAVLDELVRVEAVRRHGDGRVELVQRAFLPRGATDKLEHLGTDVADLVRTIEHNTDNGDADPRFQRRVMYHDIPSRIAPAFRRLGATQGMALLVKLDHWLAAEAAKQAVRPDPDEPLVRLGMGLYYFEESLDPPKKDRKE